MTTRIIKTETDGTPKVGMIFPTIIVKVRKEIYELIMETQPEKVTNYLARKVAASPDQTVKVGRTLTRLGSDNRIYGDFVWSLSGILYPQVAMWDNDQMCWLLSIKVDYELMQQAKDEKVAKMLKEANLEQPNS